MSDEPVVTKDAVIKAAIYFEGWSSLWKQKDLSLSNVMTGIQNGIRARKYPEWLAAIKPARIKCEIQDLEYRGFFKGTPPDYRRPVLPGSEMARQPHGLNLV